MSATGGDALLAAPSARALYLHVPFCVRKCAYCDFFSRELPHGAPAMHAYVEGMVARLGALAAHGLLEDVRTAYVGGGTPTMLGPRLLGQLVACVRSCAPRVTELSCEANPESLTDGVLRALCDAGATRISVGVQSLDDAELAALGRVHTAAQARERVRAAVACGLAVSCDLMCATPHQTDESWRRTLTQATELGVGHVSVYPLQIEEGTPLDRQVGADPAWNDPEVQARRMEAARELLEAQGFGRYEVASYAKPGVACRHNQAYWTGQPYLGLGPGASSMLTRAGYERLRAGVPQLPAAGGGVARVRLTNEATHVAGAEGPWRGPVCLELLDEAQAVAEDLMLGMRMTCGVSAELVERARRLLGAQATDDALGRCVRRGLAVWRDGRLVPTSAGWLLGNELYGELWGLAPGEVKMLECRLA